MLSGQAMGSQNLLLWGLQHDRVQFLYAVLLEGALTFGVAMDARVFPCTSPFSPCFYGILRKLSAQGGQPGPFLGSHAALSPWSHAGRVPEDPRCSGSCTAAPADKSR